MLDISRGIARKAALVAATALLLSPLATLAHPSGAQASTSSAATSETKDRWLHIRVISSDTNGETVRVNVPLDLAEAVLPTINKDRLHNGKIKIDNANVDDVDLHALMAAVRNAKDGEYVTVQGNDNDVRVAKQGGHLLVHVTDKNGKGKSKKTQSQVEIKIPMKVIDALLSAGKDELDIVAALRALSAQGDTELVSVKDDENTVRIWLDSKNVSE